MSLDLSDGRVLHMASTPQEPSGAARITLLEEIPRRVFDSCPICGDPATDEEHVPPAAMGGGKMTLTCAGCNHRLGSHVEADLIDWYDNHITLPRFTAPDVQGARRTARIPLKWTPEGEFVLLLSGSIDPAIDEMLQGGEITLAGLLPDENRCRLALLKHAYLAACLRAGAPAGADGDLVRHDLIAARDATGRSEVPYSPLAMGLTVIRHVGATPLASAPLVRAVVHLSEEPIEGVLLVGRIFVSWSSTFNPGHRPDQDRHLQVSLQVGEPISGTVQSVDP
ncbi:HNH endonuclease [Nonomuraea sp. NPDC048916]|uniref:HNH endonuclease n=1 Tax=Nonomuraea sp. NPDC048916 TaxID=3154232 RepID=UPI00340455CB